MAASGHHPERSEGAFTLQVKVRGRNEVEFPNGALKPTCKAAFEGHRNKAKCPKRGGLSRVAEAQDRVNLDTSVRHV